MLHIMLYKTRDSSLAVGKGAAVQTFPSRLINISALV